MTRWRVYQSWLRRLHIFAGLQACAGLLVFAAVTLVALEREPLQALQPPRVRQHSLSLPVPAPGDGSAAALALAVTGALDLGPVQGPWLARFEGDQLHFLLGGPAGERSISFRPRDGQVTETLAPASASALLVYLHQVRPPLFGHVDPFLVAMGLFNLLCVACLGFLAVSGLVLFVGAPRRPAYAWATLLLAAGACLAALLGVG